MAYYTWYILQECPKACTLKTKASLLKCFVKLFLLHDLIEYYHSSFVKVRYPTCEPQMQSSNPPGDFVDIYWIKFKSYFPPKIAYFLPNWLVRVHQRLVDHVICHNRVVFCRFEQLLYGILMSHLKLSCISFLFICFDVGQLYLLHNTTQTHQA